MALALDFTSLVLIFFFLAERMGNAGVFDTCLDGSFSFFPGLVSTGMPLMIWRGDGRTDEWMDGILGLNVTFILLLECFIDWSLWLDTRVVLGFLKC